MSSAAPAEVTLARFRNILQQKYPCLKMEICWKSSSDRVGRTPYLHIWKSIQTPNLRFMAYLPSFHIMVTAARAASNEEDATQLFVMQLVAYQAKIIARDTVKWPLPETVHFKLVSQLVHRLIEFP